MARKTTRDRNKNAVSGVSPLLLGNCSHLNDLSTRDLVRLSEAAECRMAFAGETLFEQGDKADTVFLLLDGSLELRHADVSGVTTGYDVAAPYATFGDLALLGEPERRYTVTAASDSVVLELPLAVLVEILDNNSAATLAWRGAITARLHRMEPGLASTFGWRILGKVKDIVEAA